MIRNNTARSLEFALLAVLAGSLILVGCPPEEENNDTIDPGEAECERDEHNEPANAAELSTDGPDEGFVCPVEDQDWYDLEVPSDHKILRVTLGMANKLSPVEPTYSVFETDSNGEPTTAVVSTPSTQIGQELNEVHCLQPGSYKLVVRDSGDDKEDFRNMYNLEATTAPDPDAQEPNNSDAEASMASSGQSITGYIACTGDEDFYQIDVPDGNLVRLKLTSPKAEYEPKLELLDTEGNVLVDETNASGSVSETDIDRFEVLPSAGTYYVKISDDDGEDADPEVPYTLLVEFVVDSDPNEPNNHPDEATALSGSPVGCGASWSQTLSSTGTIGSPGDDDWFEVPLTGCASGIIEAEVTLRTDGLSNQEAWDLSQEVQAAVTLVRGHQQSPCQDDEQCNVLQQGCSEALQCAGLLETCLQTGCAGATVCMPDDTCGANVVSRHYECNPIFDECTPGQSAPPPNRARFAAPVFGEDVVYLRVGDFQANGSAPDRLYDLNVRVITDPDSNESNNIFVDEVDPRWVDEYDDASRSQAVQVPVHDCTAGDCCGAGNWIDGAIAYQNDVDWFVYDHPCPGMDCTMAFHYRVDGGPVDAAMTIFRGGSPWFNPYELEEEGMQGAVMGTLGGTTAGDSCFYAYQGHTGNPFRYYVEVRDVFETYDDDVTVKPESRDWDPMQTYSFCVEKVSNTCSVPPCEINANDGTCDTP